MAKTLGTTRQTALIEMLIAARKKAGLTQAEFAEMLGEHQSLVSRLESGERRVDVVELIEICSILHADAAKIVADLRQMTSED